MIHCSHFSLCGGCSLPNVPYAEQLALKRAQLSSLLKLDVPPLVPSPREEGFRHKVAFVFGADASGRRIVMGHYAAQTRTIVPIDECPVHSERGNRLAFALRDELVRARVPPVLLRHVLIRTTESGREAVVMLVVTRNERVLRAPVRAFLARKDPPDGFFINVHDRPGPAMVGRETIRIAGRAHAREDALGSSFLIGPTAFFQTNVGAAGEVLRLVMEDVAGARHVLDLYSGSGLFTVPMAAAGMSVTAVEEHPQASEDAARNLRLNRVPDDRVRLIRARVEDTLPRLARTRFDAIVIDPPRQGCAAPVLPAIVQDLTPPRLIYVSCNPQILAADVPLIRRAGYTIARLQPVDMFPHTEHIETVVTFHRD